MDCGTGLEARNPRSRCGRAGPEGLRELTAVSRLSSSGLLELCGISQLVEVSPHLHLPWVLHIHLCARGSVFNFPLAVRTHIMGRRGGSVG